MFTNCNESQSDILFAGGSGITFAASVLEEIVGQASNGTCRTRSVILVWTMKSLKCFCWYENAFNALLAHAKSHTVLNVSIKLYVTGPKQTAPCTIPGVSVIAARPDIASLVEGG